MRNSPSRQHGKPPWKLNGARNARTHSDQQVAQIATSIREFGFTNPVLIDEKDGIIAGHGRVLAAHLLGLDEGFRHCPIFP
jgi:ParB-like chromosome segregation protein Spo0J